MNFNFLKSRKVSVFNKFVYAVGCVALYSYLKDTPQWFRYIFRQRKEMEKIKEKYGDGWAIITGATGGLGLSFAQELAHLGFNTVLISRDVEKLKATSADLEEKYGVKTKIIPFNFTDSWKEDSINKLEGELNSVIGKDKVSILVNNVGMQSPNDNKFEVLTKRELIDYTSVNILSQLVMYNILITKLKSQGSKSLIIDVSSSTADINVIPINSVYQATKTFNARFSKIMEQQLETEASILHSDKNVDVVSFRPGMIVSNLTERHKTKSMISDYPDNVALSCLFDIASGNKETYGTFRHKFIYSLLNIIPNYIAKNYITKNIYSQYMEAGKSKKPSEEI